MISKQADKRAKIYNETLDQGLARLKEMQKNNGLENCPKGPSGVHNFEHIDKGVSFKRIRIKSVCRLCGYTIIKGTVQTHV